MPPPSFLRPCFIVVVLFTQTMFLNHTYFVLVAKANGFCLRAQAVNSDFILNVLKTVKFVFCFQMRALAKCTIIFVKQSTRNIL